MEVLVLVKVLVDVLVDVEVVVEVVLVAVVIGQCLLEYRYCFDTAHKCGFKYLQNFYFKRF